MVEDKQWDFNGGSGVQWHLTAVTMKNNEIVKVPDDDSGPRQKFNNQIDKQIDIRVCVINA